MNDPAPEQQRSDQRSEPARSRLVLDLDQKTVSTEDGRESVSFKRPDSHPGELSEEENMVLCIALFRLHAQPELSLDDAFHFCRLGGHKFRRDPERSILQNEHYTLIPQQCRICHVRYYDVYSHNGSDGGER